MRSFHVVSRGSDSEAVETRGFGFGAIRSSWLIATTPLALVLFSGVCLVLLQLGAPWGRPSKLEALISRSETYGDPQHEAHPPNCQAGAIPAIPGPDLEGRRTIINVMSYNLFWWQLFDKARGPVGHLSIQSNGATKLIIEALRRTPYDLLGFTECEDETWLLNHAGMSAEYAIFRDRACCMAYRTRLWTLLKRGVNYVADDARFGMRPAQWMRLRHKKTGKIVFFINHHGPLVINSGGICGGYAHAYNILKVMNSHAQQGDVVVVVGDFNSDPASPAIKLLANKLHVVYGGWKSKTHIDYIFSNTPLSTVTRTADLGGGGSDHDAVGATLKVGQGHGKREPRVVEDFSHPSEQVERHKPAPLCDQANEDRFEYGIHYIVPKGSGRLHFAGVADQQQCCLRCRSKPKCKSFTFIQGGQCWLFGALPAEKQARPGTVSGLPLHEEEREEVYRDEVEESKEVVAEEAKTTPKPQQDTTSDRQKEAQDQYSYDGSLEEAGPYLQMPVFAPLPETPAPLPAPVPASSPRPEQQSSPAFHLAMPHPQNPGFAGVLTPFRNWFHR